jgi:hypothetical protein
MAHTEITCSSTVQDINQALTSLGEKPELYSGMVNALVVAVNASMEVIVTVTDNDVVLSLSGLDASTCNAVKSITTPEVSIVDLGNGSVAVATSKVVNTSTSKNPNWPYDAGQTVKQAMPKKNWVMPDPISQTTSNDKNSILPDWVSTESVIVGSVLAAAGYAAYCFFGSDD